MIKRKLRIKTDNEYLVEKYSEHGTYNSGDSGLDLFSPKDIEITCGDTVFLELEIKCEMIEYSESLNTSRNVSYYLYPRSSISKTPLILKNSVGIIDAGYRGEIKAALQYVPSNDDISKMVQGITPTYLIKKGTRLVQICSGDLEPFDFTLADSLTETTRGTGGYGSTGV